MIVVAITLAAVPVTFGAVRAMQTGWDYRYLVTGLASLAAAWGIFYAWTSRLPRRVMRAIVTFMCATLVSALVAYTQGARSAGAIWFVAAAFSLCATASVVLGLYGTKRAR